MSDNWVEFEGKIARHHADGYRVAFMHFAGLDRPSTEKERRLSEWRYFAEMVKDDEATAPKVG